VSFQASEDVRLLAERLRLGIPLNGLDGRDIPLRDVRGRPFGAIEAALMLLESAVATLPADVAHQACGDAIERATAIETDAALDGLDDDTVTARVVGVLVSASVRANMLARCDTLSPSDLNRATLGWYHEHQARRSQLLAGDGVLAGGRLTA
jgi:hypothetical protein